MDDFWLYQEEAQEYQSFSKPNHAAGEKIWPVSLLTFYIKRVLEEDSNLYNIQVQGEISNFKRAYSGHCYFKLKDNESSIDCVMFRSKADVVDFEPEDGMLVIAKGFITVYEKAGNYQLQVTDLKRAGMGEIYQKFLILKNKLLEKGYFDMERKREIPFIPGGIGIATSEQGAALQDMIKTIKRRFPPASIYIAPTVVQGDEAPASICKSIEILNKCGFIDVIIIGRGGGSFEDLNCFNNENVADSIFNSKIPVISGVGHETDFTICDMVADKRAETPTAAAAASVPEIDEITGTIDQEMNSIASEIHSFIENQKIILDEFNPEKYLRQFEDTINGKRQEIDHLWEKVEIVTNRQMEDLKNGIESYGKILEALNPDNVLKRGYAIVKDRETGNYLDRAAGAVESENVEVLFYDGSVFAEISEKRIQKRNKNSLTVNKDNKDKD